MAKGPRKKDHRKALRRKPGSFAFGIVLTAIVLLGVVGIALSRTGDEGLPERGPTIGDHYHAALGVNICGEWKPNLGSYESRNGIHSHGDGFMHIHPFSSAGTGDRATVGLFMEQGGAAISRDSIKYTDGTDLSNGDECVNLGNKPGTVRWSVNGEEQTGDPADYVPTVCEAQPGVRDVEDLPTTQCDVIALAFLPEGEEIGTPPVARSDARPSDVPPPENEAPTTPTSEPPADAATTTSVPASTDTTG